MEIKCVIPVIKNTKEEDILYCLCFTEMLIEPKYKLFFYFIFISANFVNMKKREGEDTLL